MLRLLLLFGFCCCLTAVSAQSLLHELGGVETNFKLLLGGQQLVVKDQFIIKRGESDTNTEWGVGYESYHLEFSVVGTKLPFHRRYWDCQLLFLDESGTHIGTDHVDIVRTSGTDTDDPNQLIFYSINLKDVPLTVLLYCRSINIIPYG